jgi:hypothetical protein
MFSFLDAQNVPVGAPDRTVEVALYDVGADPANPVMTGTAQFIWAIEPTVGVYVFDADFPTAGVWGAEFRTAVGDAAPETIRVGFEVQPESAVVAIGDPAPSVDTPTLADVGGDVTKISTDDEPVEAFYETSIADALAAKKPFVVVFATPKFCASRTCGPVVDVVDGVRRRVPGVEFIHVEIYEENTPALGVNRWVREWKLPTEPWVFLVGGDGRIAAKFEGAVSERELEAAVRRFLT